MAWTTTQCLQSRSNMVRAMMTFTFSDFITWILHVSFSRCFPDSIQTPLAVTTSFQLQKATAFPSSLSVVQTVTNSFINLGWVGIGSNWAGQIAGPLSPHLYGKHNSMISYSPFTKTPYATEAVDWTLFSIGSQKICIDFSMYSPPTEVNGGIFHHFAISSSLPWWDTHISNFPFTTFSIYSHSRLFCHAVEEELGHPSINLNSTIPLICASPRILRFLPWCILSVKQTNRQTVNFNYNKTQSGNGKERVIFKVILFIHSHSDWAAW